MTTGGQEGWSSWGFKKCWGGVLRQDEGQRGTAGGRYPGAPTFRRALTSWMWDLPALIVMTTTMIDDES